MSPCDRPSAISDVSEWLSMLMNPGATARPVARSPARPRAPSTSPRATMRSPSIAESSTRRRAGAVVDRAVADDDVVLRRRRARDREAGDEDREGASVFGGDVRLKADTQDDVIRGFGFSRTAHASAALYSATSFAQAFSASGLL